MKKIISLFQRNYDGDRLVRDEVVPGAEWVIAGEGIATRKWDGTCCMVRDGQLFKRHEVKPGGKPPPLFEPANDVDPETGKQQGWVPVRFVPEDRWHVEAGLAYLTRIGFAMSDGTYELCGPKINGNPEREDAHRLIRHGSVSFTALAPPRDHHGIKEWLTKMNIEGIVWHHPDGRMVKIKMKDFGLKRCSTPTTPPH